MNGSVLESNLKVVLSSLVENVNKTGYNISKKGSTDSFQLKIAEIDLNYRMASSTVCNCTRNIIQLPTISFMLLLLTSASAQNANLTDPQRSYCGGDAIRNGSALERNLKMVLSSLVENVTKTGYNISSYGENGNKIYGLVQCRGDLNPLTCRECASAAQDLLNESCGGFSSGSVQLKRCFMRYATRNFYSQLSSTNSTVQCVNSTRGLDGSISNLLKTIVEKAVSSDVLYSTGNDSGIYCLAQCWRDLNTSQCSQCLNKGLLECPQGQGFTENCMIRYEAYKFYLDAVSSPPSSAAAPYIPASGETGNGRPNLLLSIGLTIVGVVIVLLLGLFLIWKRKVIQHFYKKRLPDRDNPFGELLTAMSKSKLHYRYQTLQTATNNFNLVNKLGEGGFGSVYKGILPNGTEIAVKKLFSSKEQSVTDFSNEVNLISNVQHKNLVKLLGFSVAGTNRLLVYEYLSNKSLDHFLFDENLARLLDWQRRFEIILGIAGGLVYLHQQLDICIIHRDIKSNNILLDQNFKSKIADFGLVRHFAEDQTHLSTTIVGTRGYMAPEYLVHGHLTEKVDVYAFGVLVLEIISGRKNKMPMHTNDMPSLLSMVWNNYLSSTLSNVVDPNIQENYEEEVLQVVHVALLCTQVSARLRPSMSKIIVFLTTKNQHFPTPTQPPFIDVDSSESNTNTGDVGALEIHNSTSNVALSPATPMSLNTISMSSFGAR